MNFCLLQAIHPNKDKISRTHLRNTFGNDVINLEIIIGTWGFGTGHIAAEIQFIEVERGTRDRYSHND